MTRATHPIRPAHTTRPSGGPDACAELVRLARREAVPGMEPRAYLRRLGHAGAGIRPGLLGLYDLARAGDNRLPGGGFRPPLDDGTRGQARHLLGIAACVERFGARPTWWVSVHIRRDRPTSPDGRLTDIGIAFASRLLGGELAIADAPAWLEASLCAEPAPPPAPPPAPGLDVEDENPFARHVARRD